MKIKKNQLIIWIHYKQSNNQLLSKDAKFKNSYTNVNVAASSIVQHKKQHHIAILLVIFHLNGHRQDSI